MQRERREPTGPELVVVLATATLALAATVARTAPSDASFVRSAIHGVQAHLQLARLEAIRRHRDVGFLLDADRGLVRVYDTLGTPATRDDAILYERQLPASAEFREPEAGSPITLRASDGAMATRYRTVFSASSGAADLAGSVTLASGQEYSRVQLLASGVTRIERWEHGGWIAEP